MRMLVDKKVLWALIAILIIFALYGGSFVLAKYYLELGVEHIRKNEFAEAKQVLKRSLIFSPRNPVTHVYLGRAYLGPAGPTPENPHPQADYRLAAEYYDKALALGIEEKDSRLHAFSLEASGLAHAELGDLDKAFERHLEMIQKHPVTALWSRLFVARAYFVRLNKPEEALEILLPAPDSPRADPPALFRVYTLLARLSFFAGDGVKAENYAKLAIGNIGEETSHPDFQIAHAVLASAYVLRGEYERAEDEISKANQLSGIPNLYSCFYAQAYWMSKDYERALTIVKKTGRPANDYAYSACLAVRAKSLQALGRETEAKKNFRAYLDLAKTLPQKNIYTWRDIKVAEDALGE